MAYTLNINNKKSPMHIVTNTATIKGRVYQSVLVRQSYRENGKVKKKTLYNISWMPPSIIEALKIFFKGGDIAPADGIKQGSSLSYGNVTLILTAIRALGLDKIISPLPCQELNIILALIIGRIIDPATKLATNQWWDSTVIPEELNLYGVDEDNLYEAMDWLLPRQSAIERQLANRHLSDGSSAFYDLSSSYMEGVHCPLAKLGYSRDKKRGKLQITYGLLTDDRGCPVKIEVFPGNAADASTFSPMVNAVCKEFNLSKIVVVSDRGMISSKNIEILKVMDGVDWITALRSVSLKSLLKKQDFDFSEFESTNLIEIHAPDEYPGERLIICHNSSLAHRRASKRNSMIEATEKLLEEIKVRVEKGRLKEEKSIGFAAGKVINKYKMGKHFALQITDTSFNYSKKESNMIDEALLDGLYAIRTSLPEEKISSVNVVRHYKSLSQVERAFRSIKTTDLYVRPIHHYKEERVRAHVFLCMLAYYVTWYMKRSLRELTFTDEQEEFKKTLDPVAPAKRSDSAEEKVGTRLNKTGETVYSFQTLMRIVAAQTKTVLTIPVLGKEETKISSIAAPTSLQKKVLDLIKATTL